MILGIGIDLVDVERIRRLLGEEHAEAARARLFTPAELELAGHGAAAVESLAARFAAKEAAMKALGTGWSGGVGFRDVEVGRDASGAPTLALTGAAGERARALGVARCHVSLTHTKELAQAIVVLES
jgi:holo-[acyl-carrier protein] synthase